MGDHFVGRGHELAIAREVLAGLAGGPRALLIEGDAGIGKTAVWRAALEHAGPALVCVADQADARLSFSGLADLLGGVADELLPRLPAPQREALEVALVRRESGRAPDPMTIGVALRSLLVELARGGPVVVAVDDAQWLDAETGRALMFAVRRLHESPVGLLATVRAPLASSDPLGLERVFGERLRRVRLGGLDPAALRAVLESQLGRAYPRPALRRIARASGGNPLFALEIARALGPRWVPGAPLPVPANLLELVAHRVATVAPRVRQALLAAAALSHPRVELVERASSALGLLAAEDAGLVGVTDGRVVFAHPLYASAVYASSASARRRSVHARLAELLDDPEERVRHLALAASGPDEAVACALEDAADGARARGAWETAGELLEQASTLTPPARGKLARRRAVRAAEHHIHAGDRPRARALLEQVLRNEPAGARRAEALRLLSAVRYHEDSFADAARLLDEALVHARDGAPAIRIELSASHLHCHLGDLEGGDRHAARALELAQRLGDDAQLAEALAVRAIVDFLLARDPGWHGLERALSLEDSSRLGPLELRPSMIAAQLMAYSGRLPEARARLSALRARAADNGDESDLAHVLCWLVWLETISGDLAGAAALADEALEHALLTGSEANRAWVLAQRALVRAHRGDAEGARADAAGAREIADRLGYALPLIWATTALTLLELSLGNAAAAWAAARPLVQEVELRGLDEPLTVYFLPPALEALIELGELARAEPLLDAFEFLARRLDRAWALAAVARCRALLAAARGDLDTAEVELSLALDEHARAHMPLELARTLVVEGGIRRRRRSKRAARESLERALGLLERMGAQVWAERARDELARVSPRAAPGALTASERRVAQLAAEGCSNKQIAGALSIAVHTVEVHLSRAYAKLGVASRGQLAHLLLTQ